MNNPKHQQKMGKEENYSLLTTVSELQEYQNHEKLWIKLWVKCREYNRGRQPIRGDGSWKKNSAIHNKHVTVRKELPSSQQWQVTLTLTWLLTHTNLNKLAVIIFFVGFCFCFLFWRGTVTSSWRCSENQKKMTVMVNIIQTVKLLSSIN